MRYNAVSVLLGLMIVASSAVCAQTLQSLQDYRWQNRLLLLHPDDEVTLNQLTELINQGQSEIDDRKMQIFVTWRNRLLTFPDTKHNIKATDVLKVLVNQQAQMVLIGLDGGIKQKSAQVPKSLEEVFALIDSMPMRQSELSQSDLINPQ